jgi:5-methyltetrahydropteroyltriglutamate--homocysteine methyltransferase
MVVLGLINTKLPKREKREDLEARIRQATDFVPAERLALSPQCGFSTSIVGNRISMEDQKLKLQLLVDTARSIWGES